MARTAAQIESDISSLRTARSNLLTGGAVKSYSIGGKSFSFASLSELNELEARLLDELGEVEGSSSVILADLRGRGL